MADLFPVGYTLWKKVYTTIAHALMRSMNVMMSTFSESSSANKLGTSLLYVSVHAAKDQHFKYQQ